MVAEIRPMKINILVLSLANAILENVVYEYENNRLVNPSPRN